MQIKGKLEEHEHRSQDWKDFLIMRDKHQEEIIVNLQGELKCFRDNLPCKTHIEKFNWYDRTIPAIWAFLVFLLGVIIKIHLL